MIVNLVSVRGSSPGLRSRPAGGGRGAVHAAGRSGTGRDGVLERARAEAARLLAEHEVPLLGEGQE